MNPVTIGALGSVALFAGVLVAIEAGRRLGARDGTSGSSSATVEGAIFALLGLLVAFTFSGAMERFDARRHLIVDEVNAIGTAWLRVDLLPAEQQPAERDLFRKYLDTRLEVYANASDLDAAYRADARATALQGDIWRHAVSSLEGTPPAHAQLLLSALNEMFDIGTTRMLALLMHPPWVVFAMLFIVTLIAALLAGHGTANQNPRSWIHILALALALAATFYVIIDIEWPRHGLIRVDRFDQALIDLRHRMDADPS